MKKSIIIIFLFILGTSNILIKSKNTKVTYNKNEIISASYVIPEDLEELDENAPIILKGSFTGNRKIDEDTNIVGPSTISEFKVDKVCVKSKIVWEIFNLEVSIADISKTSFTMFCSIFEAKDIFVK